LPRCNSTSATIAMAQKKWMISNTVCNIDQLALSRAPRP
jgi:hypothetical protein